MAHFEDTNYYVYRHIRLDKNEPFYIGIGKYSKTYNRSKDTRRNAIWKNIVKKCNNNYKIQIVLDYITYEEAYQKEKEFIALYGKICDGTGTLCNILDEGTGSIKGHMSEINKQNLRDRMKNNSYGKGYKWSEEKKEKFSLSRKGYKNNLGKKWSEETKKKMAESHKGNTATKGYKWITNGVVNKRIKPEESLPTDFYYGKTTLKNTQFN
jgi:hypothetical protein